MALPDYFKNEQGTAKTWKASGGDYLLTPAGVTNGQARQGAKGDLGATWAQRWSVLFSTGLASAGTNGNEVELYWAPSPTATAALDNPGGSGVVTGTDGAFSSSTFVEEHKLMLDFIGSLPVSNNAGTGKQSIIMEFFPKHRYGAPVIVNKSGQTLVGDSSNTIHEVRLTPVEELVQDTV